MRLYIDLHMHTYFSDGTAGPEEILAQVRSRKLAAFSVTDHDTLDGYRAIRTLLSDQDPELVPGVELSTTIDGADVHILAYYFDPEHEELHAALVGFQQRRNHRGMQIVEKLNQLGAGLAYEDVARLAGGDVIGRPHIAQAMLESNFIQHYEEAFQKYIGSSGPAYVAKQNFSPGQAIQLIHSAGGVAVLAHPGIDDAHRHLEYLAGLGLDGLEAYHSSHTTAQTDQFKHLAGRYRLLVTGGSDFHGRSDRHSAIGSQRVPYTLLEQLRAKSSNE